MSAPVRLSKHPERDVFERLLLAKALLCEIDVVPTVRPDGLTTARYILIAHDAAELVLAAIARHLQCSIGDSAYLMNYVGAIKQTTGQDIPYRNFFSDLNRQRTDIKHHGLMPNVDQWGNVAEVVHRHISSLCEKYLNVQLAHVDESILVQHEEAKLLIAEAKTLYADGKYQHVLEKLAHALFVLFRDNPALRNMEIGKPRAEDAIRLTAFGVNANEFLALQEFLPSVSEDDDNVSFRWNQEEHGHPANWTAEAAEFCLNTIVHVAVRIQNATWIPSAIDFLYVYEHKVTALEDGVVIVQERQPNWLSPAQSIVETMAPIKTVIRTLAKGETIVGMVTRKEQQGGLTSIFNRSQEPGPEKLSFFSRELNGVSGEIEASKVRVTCIPRTSAFTKKYYPDLPEIAWEPS